jgi:hypothetical protein
MRFRVVAMAMQRLLVEPIVRPAPRGWDDVVELDQVVIAEGQATACTAPPLAFQGVGQSRACERVMLYALVPVREVAAVGAGRAPHRDMAFNGGRGME